MYIKTAPPEALALTAKAFLMACSGSMMKMETVLVRKYLVPDICYAREITTSREERPENGKSFMKTASSAPLVTTKKVSATEPGSSAMKMILWNRRAAT